MPDRDVSDPYSEVNIADIGRGGHRAEDEPDLDGYDESQRAQIAEIEGDGPTDGVLMTDLQPDFGGDLDDDEIEDDEEADTVIDTDDGTIQ